MTHPTDLADALEKWAKSAHTRDLYAGATSLSETLQQAAAMLRACRSGAVKVKPLEWQYDCLEVDMWNETRTACKRIVSSEHWVSSPAHMLKDYGICRIVDPRVKNRIGVTLTIGMKDYRYLDLETAKAAAQADYERRILSALEPAPDARQEGWNAGVEAAAKITESKVHSGTAKSIAIHIRALAEKGPTDAA